jgi:tetratricopeptide (TPR) repeat protein
MRIDRFWALGLAIALLGGVPAIAQDDFQRASELLQSGQAPRAAKLFEKVAAEGGERQIPALLGAAAAHNAAGDREEAAATAKRVLEATEEAVPRALAQRELAVALAAGERDAERQRELEGAVEGLRDFLRRHPADDFTDALRRGLCSAIREADLPRILSREPVLLDGAVGIEPPQGIHTPKPQASRDARRRMKVKSVAVVQGVIDEDGCVSQVTRIDSTEPFWAEIVERTFTGWVYRPAIQNGHPVPVLHQETQEFSRGRR